SAKESLQDIYEHCQTFCIRKQKQEKKSHAQMPNQVMQYIVEKHPDFEPLMKEWSEFEKAVRLKSKKIGQAPIRDRIDKANLRLLTAGTVMRKHGDARKKLIRVDESCELLLFEDTTGKKGPKQLNIRNIQQIRGGNAHPAMRNVPNGCGIQLVSIDPNGLEFVVCLETKTGIECDKWLSALQELVHAWSNNKEEKEKEKEEDKKEDKNKKQNKMNKAIDEKEEKKKWMKWWKAKNEKDKSEIISKFEHLSKSDFGIWLLHQSKWKNDLI
ncbi:exopolyphosphatase, partial [Reticulomyxa filosa]